MSRLRIGNSNLNGTFHILDKHLDRLCAVQDVKHLLLQYEKYNMERVDMIKGMK